MCKWDLRGLVEGRISVQNSNVSLFVTHSKLMTSDLKWSVWVIGTFVCIFWSLTATGSRLIAVIQYFLYAEKNSFFSEEKKNLIVILWLDTSAGSYPPSISCSISVCSVFVETLIPSLWRFDIFMLIWISFRLCRFSKTCQCLEEGRATPSSTCPGGEVQTARPRPAVRDPSRFSTPPHFQRKTKVHQQVLSL